jgi:hypothetical protein
VKKGTGTSPQTDWGEGSDDRLRASPQESKKWTETLHLLFSRETPGSGLGTSPQESKKGAGTSPQTVLREGSDDRLRASPPERYFQTFSTGVKKNPDCLHFSYLEAACSWVSEAYVTAIAGHRAAPRKRSAEWPVIYLEHEAKIKNVVAVLPGEGAKADETLVIGAHYDHLGVSSRMKKGTGTSLPANSEGNVGDQLRASPRDVLGVSSRVKRGTGTSLPAISQGNVGDQLRASPQDVLGVGRGSVYCGANDNASGVAVMMEVARILTQRPGKLPRRVVFVAFSGEETGLLGSFYYVNHPAVPLRKTIAMINLDMVGMLGDRPLMDFGASTSVALSDAAEKIFAKHRVSLTKVPFAWAGSDHMAFYGCRTPVAFFCTRGGFEDYHRPSDTAEKLDYAGMESIAEATADLAVAVAEMEKPPQFEDDGVVERLLQAIVRRWGR